MTASTTATQGARNENSHVHLSLSELRYARSLGMLGRISLSQHHAPRDDPDYVGTLRLPGAFLHPIRFRSVTELPYRAPLAPNGFYAPSILIFFLFGWMCLICFLFPSSSRIVLLFLLWCVGHQDSTRKTSRWAVSSSSEDEWRTWLALRRVCVCFATCVRNEQAQDSA